MDVVFILRELWRRRMLVAVVAVLAVVLGGSTAYRPGLPPTGRQHEIGVASSRALVDTPSSQVADLGLAEPGSDPVSLPARAALLANLLTTSPLREQIAEAARVPADRLITVADTPTDMPQRKTPVTTGASVDPDDPTANVLTFHTDASLPLITVNAEAPDTATAARLADSSLDVLEKHLASVVSANGVPADRRLVVKKLGAAGAATQEVGPPRLLAVAVGIFVFCFGCAVIVIVSTLARDWRSAAALEQAFQADDAFLSSSLGDDDADASDDDAAEEPERRRGRRKAAA